MSKECGKRVSRICLRLSLLPSESVSSFLSIVLAGIKTVLKIPFVCDGWCYPKHLILQEEGRSSEMVPSLQLQGSLPTEPASSEMLKSVVLLMHGCFHILLHPCLQGSASPLAEHRGVQVALTVPTPPPGFFLLLQDAQALCLLAFVLSGFKLFALGSLLRAKPLPFSE